MTEFKTSSELVNQINDIWEKLQIKLPTNQMTEAQIRADNNIELPSEIIEKYITESEYVAFAKSKDPSWSDAEIKKSYQVIRSFVAQLRLLLNKNDMVSGTGLSGINLVNFKALFDEPWEKYCDPNSIESRTSPVSYLVYLLKIAKHIVKFSGENAIKLEERRPDLFELNLNEETTFREVKTIALVNTILKSSIENFLRIEGTEIDVYAVFSKTKISFEFSI